MFCELWRSIATSHASSPRFQGILLSPIIVGGGIDRNMLSTSSDTGAHLNVEQVKHIVEIRMVHVIGPVSSRVWKMDMKVCRRDNVIKLCSLSEG